MSVNRILTVLVLVLGAAGSVCAGPTVTFGTDPSVGDVVFQFDNAGTDPITDDTLTAQSGGLRVGIDTTALGGGLNYFDNASLEMDASLTDVSVVDQVLLTSLHLAFDGSASIRDAGGETVWVATYHGLTIQILLKDVGGSHLTQLDIVDGQGGASFDMAAGPALQGLLGPWELASPSELHVTGEASGSVGGGSIDWQDLGNGAVRVEDFVLNGHVTGQSNTRNVTIMPEPVSATALVLAGGYVVFRRARRTSQRDQGGASAQLFRRGP